MTVPVYVPHTHVREATRVFLAHQKHPIHYVDVSGDRAAYAEYFQARWDERETFISLEHDIVPWPGAIEELVACREPWCFFGYDAGIDCAADRCAPFGLVKFDARLIAAVPDVWREMRTAFAGDANMWMYCDVFMHRYTAEGRGIPPHQHYPAVLNANPQPAGSYFPLIEPRVTEVTVWRDMDPVARIEVRGDAQLSIAATDTYTVTTNTMVASKCCNRCGNYYTFDAGGRRHCGPCAFYPDGYPGR